MFNNPLIRPYFLVSKGGIGGLGSLDSYEGSREQELFLP